MSEQMNVPDDLKKRLCTQCGASFVPTLKRWKTRCIDCTRAYKAAWARQKTANGFKREHSENDRKRYKEYGKRPEVRKKKAEDQARYRASPEYQQRLFARAQVKNAIKSGTLLRQPCEVCDKQKADAHHDDYSKPLSVRWLCRTHHTEFHWKGTINPPQHEAKR